MMKRIILVVFLLSQARCSKGPGKTTEGSVSLPKGGNHTSLPLPILKGNSLHPQRPGYFLAFPSRGFSTYATALSQNRFLKTDLLIALRQLPLFFRLHKEISSGSLGGIDQSRPIAVSLKFGDMGMWQKAHNALYDWLAAVHKRTQKEHSKAITKEERESILKVARKLTWFRHRLTLPLNNPQQFALDVAPFLGGKRPPQVTRAP